MQKVSYNDDFIDLINLKKSGRGWTFIANSLLSEAYDFEPPVENNDNENCLGSVLSVAFTKARVTLAKETLSPLNADFALYAPEIEQAIKAAVGGLNGTFGTASSGRAQESVNAMEAAVIAIVETIRRGHEASKVHDLALVAG